jgi:hypothetical protein
MQFSKSKDILNIILYLFLVAIVFSIIYYFTLSFADCSEHYAEGFDTVPIATDAKTKNIVYGYYQVDSSNMAVIPYGFAVDPKDPRKIIPITKTAMKELSSTKIPPVPEKGEKLPDDFYLASDSSLAILPPNMSPNIKNIDFSGNPAKIIYFYNNGYISETQYYENQYKPAHYPKSLPMGVYYVDPSHALVSFLKYGEVADISAGYGKKNNTKINQSTTSFNYNTSNYRDNVKDNLNVEFHDNMEDIVKQNKMYDLGFDETRVIDQCGNMVSLPKTMSQANITYYQPGEFPFGASKYVPNYEDSVYLSSVGHRTMFGNGNSSSSSCGAMCKAYNDFKTKMENYCN